MDNGEELIAGFLDGKGLRAEKFTKDEIGRSQTPDFRVFKEDKLAFFCEVKTVSKDEWLNQQFKEAPIGTIVGGARNDPTFNNLTSKTHKAVQQFDAVNPDLEYPNVLAFVNDEKNCGFLDLIGAITGNFLSDDGSKHPIYRQYSEGRIKEEKYRVNLYIWLNTFNGVQYLFNTFTEDHFCNLCRQFGIDPKSIKNVS